MVTRDKKVKVGGLVLGDGNVYIQSMLNLPAEDIKANINQAKSLESAGCDIIRAAVPEKKDAALIAALKEAVKTPIVADIHFDYKIALEAVKAGADKIRINPGNIGDSDRVKAVADACRLNNAAIRAGANSGSLKNGLDLVGTALEQVRLLERFDFTDIVVSVKSSNLLETVAAYRKLSELCRYPLHVGVTEAGTGQYGIIKSAIGIGGLLCDGIGDTVRVSLTGDSLAEVAAAKDILKAVGRRKGVEIISCPTCGRTKTDVVALAEKVAELTRGMDADIKIAVMGCAVNGPGECKHADFGVTGGDGEGLIFKKGELIRKVRERDLLGALTEEINAYTEPTA